LAQVWVLAPDVPLAKLEEDAESQKYLDTVEQAEPEVDELSRKIAENLNINIPSPDDSVLPCCKQTLSSSSLLVDYIFWCL
jgi:hypothetical protein